MGDDSKLQEGSTDSKLFNPNPSPTPTPKPNPNPNP